MKHYFLGIIYSFMIFSLTPQIKFELLNSNDITYAKEDEMRWWEWKVTNESCDSANVSFSMAFKDSLGIKIKVSFSNKIVEDSSFTIPPESQHSFVLYGTVKNHKQQELSISFHFDQTDTLFHLFAKVDHNLFNVHHCFPRRSTGLFRIHTGILDHPQVIVMNSSREILLESSSQTPFLKLDNLSSGQYIIQIGEDEFIVDKVQLLDSN